jgi:hypothetical protein
MPATGIVDAFACEGAVVACRAERSLEPLDTVAAHLRELVAGAA